LAALLSGWNSPGCEVALKLYEALNELMKSTKLINSLSYIEEAFKNSPNKRLLFMILFILAVSAEKKARLATLDPKLKKVAEKKEYSHSLNFSV
jgi:predicted nucleic acid-binding protein